MDSERIGNIQTLCDDYNHAIRRPVNAGELLFCVLSTSLLVKVIQHLNV